MMIYIGGMCSIGTVGFSAHGVDMVFRFLSLHVHSVRAHGCWPLMATSACAAEEAEARSSAADLGDASEGKGSFLAFLIALFQLGWLSHLCRCCCVLLHMSCFSLRLMIAIR
jgi:hypothetical protein